MIFNGLTVLTEDPNRRDQILQTATRSKTRLDSTTGPFTEIVRGTAGQGVRTFHWFMASRADINNFRAFTLERQGRLVPFYLPTWHHDLRLNQDQFAPGGTLEIENIGYTRYMWDPLYTWKRYLAIIQIGVGIVYTRTVTAAVEGTTTETLTLDAGLPVALTKAGWMISFLTLCRLERDDVTLHWHLPTAAEGQFDYRELPLEQPTTP